MNLRRAFRSQPLTHRQRRGFTLVVTLLSVAALLLLVLGLFTNVTSESTTARHYDGSVHAQMAVQSGLSRVEAMLERGTWSDDYLILEQVQNPSASATPSELEWRQRKPVVTLARAKVAGDTTTPNGYTATWEYTPLVSGVTPPPSSNATPSLPKAALTPRNDPETGEPNLVASQLPKRLPWQQSQDTFWEVIYQDVDADNDPKTAPVRQPVARYCFYVEDLQGLLSLDHAGNPGIDRVEETAGMVAADRLHEREKFQVFESIASAQQNPRFWYAGFAPGLRTPDDDPLTDDTRWSFSQAALYSLVSPSSTVDSTLVDNHLMAARRFPRTGSATPMFASLFLGPDSWKSVLSKEDTSTPWATFLTRQRGTSTDAGRLADGPARRLEENSITGLQAYHELPLVPAEPGVFAHPRQPRLNLNRVLADLEKRETSGSLMTNAARNGLRADAVNGLVTHLEKHLPNFGEVRGQGMPVMGNTQPSKVYLQNLAANILDYADTDNQPTTDTLVPDDAEELIADVDAGKYRGIDSYPLVNEQFVMHKWENPNAPAQNGRFTIRLSVQHFFEFWNMTSRPVKGRFEAEYAYKGKVEIGSSSSNTALSPEQFSKIPVGSYKPQPAHGSYWMSLHHKGSGIEDRGVDPNTQDITIMPNEHVVLGTRKVVFELDGGEAKVSPVGPAPALVEDKSSYYRVRFQPAETSVPKLYHETEEVPVQRYWTIIDRTRARLKRAGRTSIGFKDLEGKTQNSISSATVPGFSYHPAAQDGEFKNNLGDVRGSYHFTNQLLQASNDYDENTSCGARNLRHDISPNFIWREVKPWNWADRGHECGLSPVSAHCPNDGVSPQQVAAPFPTGVGRQFLMTQAPQRISNTGRFFSVTELGNLYDPLFWDPAPNMPESQRGSTSDDRGYLYFWDLPASAKPSAIYHVGGTMRVGRPEHTRFRSNLTRVETAKSWVYGVQSDRRLAASTLLDLFHCGNSTVGSTRTGAQAQENLRDLTGPLTYINGHVNVNTASRDTLRALCAGALGRNTTDSAANTTFRPPTSPSPDSAEADLVADAIIRNRPYLSPTQLAEKVRTTDNQPVFGQMSLTQGWSESSGATGSRLHDAGREELFVRVFNQSTTRSRHFRVYVTGQSVKPVRGQPGQLAVQASRSRCYHLFARPVRHPETGLITDVQIISTYEQDL